MCVPNSIEVTSLQLNRFNWISTMEHTYTHTIEHIHTHSYNLQFPHFNRLIQLKWSKEKKVSRAQSFNLKIRQLKKGQLYENWKWIEQCAYYWIKHTHSWMCVSRTIIQLKKERVFVEFSSIVCAFTHSIVVLLPNSIDNFNR